MKTKLLRKVKLRQRLKFFLEEHENVNAFLGVAFLMLLTAHFAPSNLLALLLALELLLGTFVVFIIMDFLVSLL